MWRVTYMILTLWTTGMCMTSPPTPHPLPPVRCQKPMKKPPKKRKRQPYIDDGHTVYDMSAFYDHDKKSPTQHVGLSRKEKFAAILAAFQCYFPLLLIALGSFALVMFLIKLWLGA